jgi:hypothetical protein
MPPPMKPAAGDTRAESAARLPGSTDSRLSMGWMNSWVPSRTVSAPGFSAGPCGSAGRPSGVGSAAFRRPAPPRRRWPDEDKTAASGSGPPAGQAVGQMPPQPGVHAPPEDPDRGRDISDSRPVQHRPAASSRWSTVDKTTGAAEPVDFGIPVGYPRVVLVLASVVSVRNRSMCLMGAISRDQQRGNPSRPSVSAVKKPQFGSSSAEASE